MRGDEGDRQEYAPDAQARLGPPKGPPRPPTTAVGFLDSFFDDDPQEPRLKPFAPCRKPDHTDHTGIASVRAFFYDLLREMRRAQWPEAGEVKRFSLVIAGIVMFLTAYLLFTDRLIVLISEVLNRLISFI